MDEESTYITASLRKLEKYVRTLPVMRQLSALSREERGKLHAVQDALSEARRLANDAATSDEERIKQASLYHCREHLEVFRDALLAASYTNLIDAVDVAQLSAMADQVGDLVRKRVSQ